MGIRRTLAITVLLALLCSPLATAPLSATTLADTVFARMPAAAYGAVRVPAVRLLDYGSFVWLELTPEQMAELEASGQPFQLYENATTLALAGASFDTRRGEPAIAASMRSPEGQRGFYLVQMVGPVRSEWLAALEGAGLVLLQYSAPFSYIGWGDGPAVESARRLPFVRWAGAYHPAYRISPQVRRPAEEIRGYALTLYPEGLQESLEQIRAWGGQIESQSPTWFAAIAMSQVVVEIGPEYLEDLARLPNLYAISTIAAQGSLRDEMSCQIVADNQVGGVPQPGYLAWLASKGLDGTGVTVAIVDTGTDYGHTDLGVDRFAACLDYDPYISPPPACSGQNWCGTHGTMTAGIAVGDGETGAGDGTFLYGLGMAPEADLIVQNFLCGPGGGGTPPPDGWRQLSRDTVQYGGYVQGNSWGPDGTPQGYDAKTREFDFMPRDADPWTTGNEAMLFSLSIMNGSGGISTQGTPDEAKNLLRVGGTMNYRAGAIDNLCTCSAHGPALDGRLLPDIVAPGQTIYSTTPGNGHSSGTGTSFASPHATGAAALFIEWYSARFGAIPSPALIKAAFVNGADDLYGGLDADGVPLTHIPNNQQGWGRLNMETVLDANTSILYYDQEVLFGDSGESWTQQFTVADPSRPFKVTLVWTDAPGPGLGGSSPAWVNDLDLVVSQGGVTWLGNVFDQGWSIPGGGADYRNNIENVYLENASGSFQVTVQAANIPGDGVPGNGDLTDQDFALVCWNCYSEPDFSVSADPDQHQVCAPETVTSAISVGQVLSYTQQVTLEVGGMPAGVSATVSPAIVTPPAPATLTVEVGPAAADGSYTLVVSGTAELTNVHTVAVDLLVSSSVPDAPALLSPPDGATGQPYEELIFTWERLPQVLEYSFQVDVDPLFAAPVVSATNIPSGTYTVETGLQPSSCYFWRVLGENGCGEGPWAQPFHFGTVWLDQAFWDDVEGGGAGWTATGLWHITTDPANPCAEAHSGSSSWYYGQEPQCNYDIGTNSGTLTLVDPIDLSGALAPVTLGFWSWEQTENYGGYDTRTVYLSSNGSTWSPVWESNNNAAAWYAVEIDASSYVGGDLYIRFEFDTVDSLANDYRGWYVDDIEVIAGLAPADPPAVTAITPDWGYSFSPTPVVISGTAFLSTPVVLLDRTALLDVSYVNSTVLTAVVPVGLPAGVYTLTVINPDCQQALLTDAFTVVDLCLSPTVALSSNSPVELGQVMHLTATVLSGTGPFAYEWEMGGAGMGSGLDTATPAYTYTDYGAFSVAVTVTNACGSGVATGTVEVTCQVPTASFVHNSPVTLGQVMAFTATVGGTGPLSISWDLGDGGSRSGELNMVYTYTQAGGYTVVLTVTGRCGTAVYSDTVTVLPVAAWHEIYLPVVSKGTGW